MRPLRTFIPVVLALASSAVVAEQAAVPGVSGASFLQGLFGLIFVIGLLVFAAWMMRRLSASGALGNTNGLRVVAGLSLGPRERILLIEVGDTWVVVGVTASQMRTLHTMAKGELPPAAVSSETGSFAGWLRQAGERNRDRA